MTQNRPEIGRLVLLLVIACSIIGCTSEKVPTQIHSPATFSGEIPCADCPGNLITLTLRSDSLFLMRQVYREAVDGLDKAFVEWGRWTRDHETGHLLLVGGDFLQKFTILDDQHLLMLDQYGQPMESDLNYTLVRIKTVDAFADTLHMTGRYVYFADAGRYWDCRFRTDFPVSQQGDNAILERAYSSAIAMPTDTVLITFDGRLDSLPAMDGDGLEERVIVDRLLGIWPDLDCGTSHKPVTLEYTEWTVVAIDRGLVLAGQGQQPPHLRIIPIDSTIVGYTGCNRFRGTVEYGSERIAIIPTVLTKKACPPGLTMETDLIEALKKVTTFTQRGDTLSLSDRETERVRLIARK